MASVAKNPSSQVIPTWLLRVVPLAALSHLPLSHSASPERLTAVRLW